MADEDQDQKTEAPTGKRLDEAREQGRIPVSREIASWTLFVGILIVVSKLMPDAAGKLILVMRVFLEMPHAMSLDDHGLQTVVYSSLMQVASVTATIFIILTATAVLGTMVQTGFFASLDLLKPDFERLSPMRGIKRLFSTTALVEMFKSFGKLVVLGIIVFYTLLPVVEGFPMFIGRPLSDVLAMLEHETVHLLVMMLLVFTVIALADLYYQRFDYIKNLRMTKTEVKDEFRQQEGDPMIKSRLRQIRLEKARKRMMAQVPKADVVVTNPTHYAIALKYDNSRNSAPLVLAKGTDRVAERIREVADEHKIPLISNPPLARALYDTVEIDHEIPTQHYKAVAEVISYVYKLKKRKF